MPSQLPNVFAAADRQRRHSIPVVPGMHESTVGVEENEGVG
jgi:hypothetical protein